MKNFHTPCVVGGAALVAVAAAIGIAPNEAAAAPVHLAADCTPQLHGTKQRLYDKANESPEALRRFIFLRRSFILDDTATTAVWAADVNAARDRCMDERAGAGLSASAAR